MRNPLVRPLLAATLVAFAAPALFGHANETVKAGIAVQITTARKASAAASSACTAGVAAGSANSNAAYSAGVAAGATAATAAPTAAAAPTHATGAIYATLPAGAVHVSVGGKEYFVSNGTWFLPAAGANGVYYTVVPAP